MTGWRHANGDMTWINVPSNPPICMDCIAENEHPYDFCNAATSDPSSPCGFEGCGDPRGNTRHAYHGPGYGYGISLASHPHVPTLCTCGHPIEAALREREEDDDYGGQNVWENTGKGMP